MNFEGDRPTITVACGDGPGVEGSAVLSVGAADLERDYRLDHGSAVTVAGRPSDLGEVVSLMRAGKITSVKGTTHGYSVVLEADFR